ncbi:hypothetical protein RDI58_007389 [Solanum bulbocastanum]|uniref:Uncharacterized protein n=1 Tax=Solanum bulbocastanum TaxID=147425 RepID=A0AAN8TYQ0_SOLBU
MEFHKLSSQLEPVDRISAAEDSDSNSGDGFLNVSNGKFKNSNLEADSTSRTVEKLRNFFDIRSLRLIS